MSQPLVSVVIPTYNYGHLVNEAVDSVLAQTYPNVEIIVVDDGSTDDSRQRLAAYGDRIRYHYQANAGLSAARNTGIELATGELIALLDSDDAFHPRKLEQQVDFLASHPKVGLVGTASFSDEPREWSEMAGFKPAATGVTLDALVMKARFAPSSVLVHRRCFDRAGLFDINLKSVEDRDMWIRIAAQDRVAMLSLPLTWYRQTPGSMSRNAGKMEHFERVVLGRAFEMPQLRQKCWLRRQAFGLVALAAARRYQGSKIYSIATHRLIESILTWPLPYSTDLGVVPLGRCRLLIAILRESLGLRAQYSN